MLPDFLKAYKKDIDKYKLDTVRIKATPIKEGKSLPIKKSKLLGKPYSPVTQPYPINKYGKPMLLFAQINFEDMPPLKNYPSKGIFQVFVSDFFWDCGNEYYLYLYHEDTTQKHQTDFSFLENLETFFPITREHKLTFFKDVDFGGLNDFRFNLNFNGKSFIDFEDELSEKEANEFNKFFRFGGHKIGGYASFIQGDPRQYEPENKNDVLLLQLDSDKEFMWGDAGIANIFINIDDLKKKRFDKAYFTMDCA